MCGSRRVQAWQAFSRSVQCLAIWRTGQVCRLCFLDHLLSWPSPGQEKARLGRDLQAGRQAGFSLLFCAGKEQGFLNSGQTRCEPLYLFSSWSPSKLHLARPFMGGGGGARQTDSMVSGARHSFCLLLPFMLTFSTF